MSVGWAQRPDPGPGPRPDPTREAQLKQVLPVTTGVREDDHPAAAAGAGAVWIAWVSYSETEGNTHVYARRFASGAWSDPESVTESAGDYAKPALAVSEDGSVWIAWAAQAAGNWDIYGRSRRPDGKYGPIERWTRDPAPDTHPSLAASAGTVLLVWQSMRRESSDILYRTLERGSWGPEAFVSDSPANDWGPAVAASHTGEFHVVWDSHRGDYDVLAKTFSARRGFGPEIAVAASPRLENHASVTVDRRGRAWIAWEVGPEGWASDSANGGLRARREIALAALVEGRLHRAPAAEAALAAVAGQTGMQAPLAVLGRDGRLRLFFRQPVNRNWLAVASTVWDGAAWTEVERLPYSEGRIDQRVVAAESDRGTLACYPAGSSHNILYARLYESGKATARDLVPALTIAPETASRRAPARSSPHMLRGHRLVWGDLHRHTDISEDGGIIDGSLEDAMRYARDAAGLDFIGVTDHTRYLPRRYNLWRIQQATDLFHRQGQFVPMHAYERSQYSPWGHRNVVHLGRDYVPVPANYEIGDAGVSPWGLFEALRGKQALSIPHTSAWANKQVSWEYFDPEVERLVEIYQGLRSTYEYAGAPDPAGKAVYEADSKSFVWDALARGLRLGFIASSDHRSTHMSFAAVYTRALDRDSIFEALRARRTYAATDKIVLDFTIGEHVMGEEIAVEGLPELRVAIEGTADLAQVDVIRNGAFVYTSKPAGRSARFTYRDESYRGAGAYYYVRAIQADKQMAWSSPIWVRPAGRTPR